MEIKDTVAKESGHFYTTDGEPAYTVIGKNGKERPTTIRDCRNLGLVPSVTTIIKSGIPAPGLEKWKLDMAITSALTIPEIEGESLDAKKKRIEQDWQQQANDARNLGTTIHTQIEYALQSKPYDPLYAVYVDAVMETLAKLAPNGHGSFKGGFWATERSFAHIGTDGVSYAGKCDLHSPTCVIDFKTTGKTWGLDSPPAVYEEHELQLAAYAYGLGLHYADRYIMYISTVTPGLVHLAKVEVDKKDTSFEVFKLLARTFNLRKGL